MTGPRVPGLADDALFEWRRPPLVPEIELRLFADEVEIGRADRGGLFAPDGPQPYWAIAWAGGQALARHLLDHPQIVRGQSAVDVGCGSGICAIAAALAGAREVVACDRDPAAVAASVDNARRNGIALRGQPEPPEPPPADGILLAADMFYDEAISAQMLALTRRWPAAQLADPDRGLLAGETLECDARYRATTCPNVESAGAVEVSILTCQR